MKSDLADMPILDHINVKLANSKGIKVGHTPGVLSDAVADITVMLVLMTMRRVEEGIALIKSGGVRTGLFSSILPNSFRNSCISLSIRSLRFETLTLS